MPPLPYNPRTPTLASLCVRTPNFFVKYRTHRIHRTYLLTREAQQAQCQSWCAGLGSFRFARRYSGNPGNGFCRDQRTDPRKRHSTYWFLFLRVLRCFNSPGSPAAPITVQHHRQKRWGFPIRRSPDQRLLVTSPKLIADMLRPSSPFQAKASTERSSFRFLSGNLKTA